jgi:hypothetical protein
LPDTGEEEREKRDRTHLLVLCLDVLADFFRELLEYLFLQNKSRVFEEVPGGVNE